MSSRDEKLSLAAVVALVALWAFLLRDEAGFAGLNRNDFAAHESFALALSNAFRHGSLGIDLWYDGCCLGAPVFRTYQNLGYFIPALLHWAFGISLSHSLHWLASLALVLQTPAFYVAARRFAFSPAASVIAAALPLLVASPPAGDGNSLLAYLAVGPGLYTQALAIPPLVLALGSLARLAGQGDRPALRVDALEAGLWSAACFLLHHLCGYLLAIAFVVAFLFRPRALGGLLLAAAVAAALSSYQLLSLWQDVALLHQSPWEHAYRFDGFGFRALAPVLAWWDYGRAPLMTVLVALGLFAGRGAGYLRALLIVAVLFMIGRAGLPWLALVPGVGAMHLQRFSVLVDICGTLLAARGAAVALEWLRPKALLPLGVVALAALCGSMLAERMDLLKRERELLRGRHGLALDAAFAAELSRASRGGWIWTPIDESEHPPKLADVPYGRFLPTYGFPVLSANYFTFFYPTDALHALTPRAAALFGVSALVLRAGETSRATLVPVPDSGESSSVVVSKVERVLPTSRGAFFEAVARSTLEGERLPAIIPSAVFDRFPEAAPRAGERYAILRRAYHPRWRILVDGRQAAPKWLGPGLLGLPPRAPEQTLSVEFPSDPLRAALFLAGLASAVMIAARLRRPSPSLRAFAPRGARLWPPSRPAPAEP